MKRIMCLLMAGFLINKEVFAHGLHDSQFHYLTHSAPVLVLMPIILMLLLYLKKK